MLRAYEDQLKSYDVMKHFFKSEVIEEETEMMTITWGKEHKHEITDKFKLFHIVGKNIGEMPLKFVFDMLQNWYYYIEDLAHEKGYSEGEFENYIKKIRFLEINIGGENYRFGIQLKVGSKNIIVLDSTGIAQNYTPLFEMFDAYPGGVRTIADHLIAAANAPINNQPIWIETMKESSEQLMNGMRMFMLISQISEGARPSEDFFYIMENLSKKLINSKKRLRWRILVEKFLIDNGFDLSMISEMDEIKKDAYFHELYLLVEESLNSESNFNSSKVSQKLPGWSKHFYSELIEANRMDLISDGITSFLRDLLVKKMFDVNNKYDLNSLKECIQRLQFVSIHNAEEVANAYRNVSEMLPPLTRQFCEGLKADKKVFKGIRGEVFIAVKEFKKEKQIQDSRIQGEISSSTCPVKEVKEERIQDGRIPGDIFSSTCPVKEVNEEKIQNGRITAEISSSTCPVKKVDKIIQDGRIPGAGMIVRGLLEEMRAGKIKSFKHFSEIFVLSEKGGLVQARRHWSEIHYSQRLEETMKFTYIEEQERKVTLDNLAEIVASERHAAKIALIAKLDKIEKFIVKDWLPILQPFLPPNCHFLVEREEEVSVKVYVVCYA